MCEEGGRDSETASMSTFGSGSVKRVGGWEEVAKQSASVSACVRVCVCVKEDVRVGGGSKIQLASVSACVSVCVKEGGRKSRNEVSKCECLCVRDRHSNLSRFL